MLSFFIFSPSDCLQKVRMEGGTEVSGKFSARCSSSLDNISFLKDEQSRSLSVTAHENSLYLPDLISQDWVCFSLQLPELPPRVIFPSPISPSNHRLKIPSNFLAVPFLLTSVLPWPKWKMPHKSRHLKQKLGRNIATLSFSLIYETFTRLWETEGWSVQQKVCTFQYQLCF